jgi:protein phosphatase
MRLDIAAQSDIGRRKKTNEDSYGVFLEDSSGLQLFRHGGLLIVADGLGGHGGGDIASKLAVSNMKDVVQEPAPSAAQNGEADQSILDILKKYVVAANDTVFQTNKDLVSSGKPMGTTLITALVSPRKLYICNVGDSRAYHIRDGEIIEITEDHSWVDEQVKLGLMSKTEAEMDSRKNIVTRSIGTHAEVDADTYLWHILPGDWILLCSDGLVNMVKDSDILGEFVKGGTAAEIAVRLVHMANENGGKDNITVIAANISPNPFRLLYMRLRSFVRRQGLKLLWLFVTLAVGIAGFIGGYLAHSMGIDFLGF